MPRIPEHFIADLLQRVDVVDLVGQYVPLKKKGTNYFGPCPFHQEKTASFSVSPDKHFYHCFGCGVHGNAIRFLMAYQGLGFVEAVQELALRAGLVVPTVLASEAVDHTRLYDLMGAVANHYHHVLPTSPAQAYLAARGITTEMVSRFRLGYASGASLRAAGFGDAACLAEVGLLTRKDNDPRYFERFRRRLIFPIEDHRGRVVGFGGRLLGEGNPKYLNSPETPIFVKGAHLYGFPQARQAMARAAEVFVVEGYMDVISLHQAGVEQSVAVLGTACSLNHIQFLARYVPHIIFCFDGDSAGEQAATRVFQHALQVVDDTHRLSFLFLPEGMDPDSVVQREGRSGFDAFCQQHVMSFSQYFFRLLLSQAGQDMTSPEGKASFIHLLRTWIQPMVPSALRFSLLQKSAAFVHMAVSALQQLLADTAKATVQKGQHRVVAAKTAETESSHTMTIERKLFILLFFCPTAYQRIPLSWVIDTQADASALRFLLTWCAQQPPAHLSTAYLSEVLADTPWAPWLSLAWSGVFPYLSETEWTSEWDGALILLEKQYVELTCHSLVTRAQRAPLSESEQEQLRDVLLRLAALKRLSAD